MASMVCLHRPNNFLTGDYGLQLEGPQTIQQPEGHAPSLVVARVILTLLGRDEFGRSADAELVATHVIYHSDWW